MAWFFRAAKRLSTDAKHICLFSLAAACLSGLGDTSLRGELDCELEQAKLAALGALGIEAVRSIFNGIVEDGDKVYNHSAALIFLTTSAGIASFLLNQAGLAQNDTMRAFYTQLLGSAEVVAAGYAYTLTNG